MKQRIKSPKISILILILLLVWLAIPASAQGNSPIFPEPPEEGTFFVDLADMLTAQDELSVNARASELFASEGIPLFVVTINSLAEQDAAEYTIERYATAMFSIWGIGSPEDNRGVLFLISQDDRAARIELGADWEISYNRRSQNIMDNDIIPHFRAGAFSEGIVDGVNSLAAMIEDGPTAAPSNSGSVANSSSPSVSRPPTTVSPSADNGSSGGRGGFGTLIIFILVVLGGRFLNGIRGVSGGKGSYYQDDGHYDSGRSYRRRSSSSSSRRSSSSSRRRSSSFGSRSSSGRSRSRSSRSGGFSRGRGASGGAGADLGADSGQHGAVRRDPRLPIPDLRGLPGNARGSRSDWTLTGKTGGSDAGAECRLGPPEARKGSDRLASSPAKAILLRPRCWRSRRSSPRNTRMERTLPQDLVKQVGGSFELTHLGEIESRAQCE